MSTNRPRRIDRDTAEQLLGAREVGAAAGHEALAGLLAAASAPVAAGELPGQRAALAAFRAARLDAETAALSEREPAAVPPDLQVPPVPAVPRETRRRPMPVAALAQLLSVKVVAVAAATALGGFALAAGTGHLPAALGGGGDDRAEARPGAATPGPTASGSPRTRRDPGYRPEAPAPTGELAELCRGYGRLTGAQAAQALAGQRYAALVAAAGGPAGVPAYCAPVLHAPSAGPSPAASPSPTHPGKGGGPGAHPSPGGRGKQPGHPAHPTHPAHTSRPAHPTHAPKTPRTRPSKPSERKPAPPAKGRDPGADPAR
ncbi:hypothetical protein [Streptomyces sp. NPDC093225]|uniref:hypothetical protein n=1 Tax=Streptomyces sp. NPDC093225 TaxID=3366034 RepID=UPI0038267328